MKSVFQAAESTIRLGNYLLQIVEALHGAYHSDARSTFLTQSSIWTTQDNASISQEEEDPLGYKKLIVSALRTLQSYYNGSQTYERISTDRYGNDRTVQYKYIGKVC
jgi:hypothetical protein